MRFQTMLAGLLGVFVLCTAAHAEEDLSNAPPRFGIAGLPCELYNNPDADHISIHQLAIPWVQGRLSGMDFVRVGFGNQKSFGYLPRDEQNVESRLDDICRAHPSYKLYVVADLIAQQYKQDIQAMTFTDGDENYKWSVGVGGETCTFFNEHEYDGIGFFTWQWFEGAVEGMDNEQKNIDADKAVLGRIKNKDVLERVFAHVCHTDPKEKISFASQLVYLNALKRAAEADRGN